MSWDGIAYTLLLICLIAFVIVLRVGTDGPRHWIPSDTPERDTDERRDQWT